MDADVQVTVNGLPEHVPASATLTQLIVRFAEQDPDLIVEHNGRFVFPCDYESIRVVPGDRIEFIHPNFGG
jgi:thiamine biosynthesis protein ThiS